MANAKEIRIGLEPRGPRQRLRLPRVIGADRAWNGRAFTLCALLTPFLAPIVATGFSLIATVIFPKAYAFSIVALTGAVIGLPAYVLLGLPAFRIAISHAKPSRAALVLNIVCAGQIANLLGYPIVLALALLIGADPSSAQVVARGHLVGGATLGLLNCLVFASLYARQSFPTQRIKEI
ncbi:MAG: hypothetical protein AAGE80_16610 [Pseudomonadota bacterium]